MTKKLVNLTPHPIYLVGDKGGMALLPSGTVARCEVQRERIGEIMLGDATLPVYRSTLGAVEGLPDPAEDTVYIVSSLVAQAVPDRDDVLFPDELVRDENGRVIGARALSRVG